MPRPDYFLIHIKVMREAVEPPLLWVSLPGGRAWRCLISLQPKESPV